MKKQIDWLYKPANVSADKYNGELMNLIHAVNPNFESTAGRQFYPVDHELFKKTCPDLMSLITKWGLQDRLSEVAIIWLNKGAKFGIHRDFPSWRARNLALNIPIINCNNSYTVWYDVELAKEKDAELQSLDTTYGDNNYIKHTQAVKDESKAVEIARIESNRCWWVNVFQPHAPVVNHDNFRALLSVRFWPEIFDVLASGQFDQEFVDQ